MQLINLPRLEHGEELFYLLAVFVVHGGLFSSDALLKGESK